MGSVSIIVTAYDRSDFVKNAINSIKDFNAEKILVTNLNLQFEGVRTVYSDSANFGKFILAGVEESKGDIIAFLNDDDTFMREKESLLLNQKEAFFRHGVIRIKGDKKKKDGIDCEGQKCIKYFPKIYNDSSISVKRELIEKYSYIIKKIKRSVDSALFVLAVDVGYPVKVVKKPYSYYYIHSGNTSSYIRSLYDYLYDREVLYRAVRDRELQKILFKEIEYYRSILSGYRGERYRSAILKYNIYNLILSYISKLEELVYGLNIEDIAKQDQENEKA